MLKKIIKTLLVLSLLVYSGCSKSTEGDDSISSVPDRSKLILSNGYGDSRENAVEDAKNDALRQFGFNIVEINGKPELSYAGRIVDFEIIRDYSEPLKNGVWWEIKIQAEIEKL